MKSLSRQASRASRPPSSPATSMSYAPPTAPTSPSQLEYQPGDPIHFAHSTDAAKLGSRKHKENDGLWKRGDPITFGGSNANPCKLAHIASTSSTSTSRLTIEQADVQAMDTHMSSTASARQRTRPLASLSTFNPAPLNTTPRSKRWESLTPSASPSPPSRYDETGSTARLSYSEKVSQAATRWDFMEEENSMTSRPVVNLRSVDGSDLEVSGKPEAHSLPEQLFSTTSEVRQNTSMETLDAWKEGGVRKRGRILSMAEVARLCEGIDFEEDVDFSFETERSGGSGSEIVASTLTKARIIKRSSPVPDTNQSHSHPMLSHDLFSPSSSSLPSFSLGSPSYDPLVSSPKLSPHSSRKLATTSSSPLLFMPPFVRPSSKIRTLQSHQPFSTAASLSATSVSKMLPEARGTDDPPERDEILLELRNLEKDQVDTSSRGAIPSTKRGAVLKTKVIKKVVAPRSNIIEISDGEDVVKTGTSTVKATRKSLAALPKARGKAKMKAILPAIEVDLSDDDEVKIISAPPINLSIDSSPSTTTATAASTSELAPTSKPTLSPFRPGFFRRPFPLLDETAPAPPPSRSILAPLPVSIIRAETNKSTYSSRLAKPDQPLTAASIIRAETTKSTYSSRLTKPDKPLTALQSTKKAKLDKIFDKQQKLRADYPIDFEYTKWKATSGGNAELIYTSDEKVVEKVLKKMTGPLGFDLEWLPANRKGRENKTALVQVCDEHTILLAQVSRMKKFPLVLKELIEDPKRVKLGVQIGGDALKLQRDFDFHPQGLLELNNVARSLDPNPWIGRTGRGLIGLQDLCAMYLDRYLPKEFGIRCGNWEVALQKEQQHYAANDVFSSLQIFLHLQSQALAGRDLTLLASDNPRTCSTFQPSRDYLNLGKIPFLPASASSILAQDGDNGKGPVEYNLPTLRQREAHKLWHDDNLSIHQTSAQMSTFTAIKPITVVWSVLHALAGTSDGAHEAKLGFDKSRLETAIGDIEESDIKDKMLSEFQQWLALEGILVDR